jgi:hypothetical protein
MKKPILSTQPNAQQTKKVVGTYMDRIYINIFWQNIQNIVGNEPKCHSTLQSQEMAGVDLIIKIFCHFRQFSAKKLAFFFSKTYVMIKILQILAVVRAKNASFFSPIFCRKYFF